jgi:hypothetical protein
LQSENWIKVQKSKLHSRPLLDFALYRRRHHLRDRLDPVKNASKTSRVEFGNFEKGGVPGEDLFSMQDARNLIRYGGMRPDRDYLQFDCALSYGLVEYLRTLDMLKEHGWSPSRCIPHGGHQMSLNIAAGLGLGGNESYPDLFQPFGGFPDGVKVVNSYVTLPDLPASALKARPTSTARSKRCRTKSANRSAATAAAAGTGPICRRVPWVTVRIRT